VRSFAHMLLGLSNDKTILDQHPHSNGVPSLKFLTPTPSLLWLNILRLIPIPTPIYVLHSDYCFDSRLNAISFSQNVQKMTPAPNRIFVKKSTPAPLLFLKFIKTPLGIHSYTPAEMITIRFAGWIFGRIVSLQPDTDIQKLLSNENRCQAKFQTSARFLT